VFAVASLVTPVLLGVAVGAVASGAVGEGGPGTGEGFYGAYVAPWLAPFPFAVGLFALACFAFLAAVYLTLEAGDDDLREDFRRRAIGAGALVFVAAALGLVLSGQAPLVGARLVALTGIAAVCAFIALWTRRYRAARVAAAAQVSLVLWGWGLAQFPYLLPPDLTIAGAAAPAITLRLALGVLGLGALVLFPSLYYLFRVFKGTPR
jgi:cytochrome d ubiquinol oxidase subunit II